MTQRLYRIALILFFGLLVNTVIFWGDQRFLSPFIPVFLVALTVFATRHRYLSRVRRYSGRPIYSRAHRSP